AVLSHRAEPRFILQLFAGYALDHIQKLLCDQALELAKRLLREDRSNLLLLLRYALAQNQFPSLGKQGHRWLLRTSLRRRAALQIRQLRKLAARELEEPSH